MRTYTARHWNGAATLQRLFSYCSQKAPCAIQIPHDDPKFTTTQEEQEERIAFMASVTDAMIRAQVLHDSQAAKYLLHEVPYSPLLSKTHLSKSCYEAPAVAQSK